MSDKMREQFEVWWEDNKHFMLATRKVSKSDCLHIWEASRKTVAVELPQPEPLDIDCDESLEMDPDEYESLEAAHGARWSEYSRLKKAIEAQGMKVKS